MSGSPWLSGLVPRPSLRLLAKPVATIIPVYPSRTRCFVSSSSTLRLAHAELGEVPLDVVSGNRHGREDGARHLVPVRARHEGRRERRIRLQRAEEARDGGAELLGFLGDGLGHEEHGAEVPPRPRAGRTRCAARSPRTPARRRMPRAAACAARRPRRSPSPLAARCQKGRHVHAGGVIRELIVEASRHCSRSSRSAGSARPTGASARLDRDSSPSRHRCPAERAGGPRTQI